MKRLFNILLTVFIATTVFCFSCDEPDDNVKVSTEKFDIGMVKWDHQVTNAQQREVISELINNMVLVEPTLFYMGAQSRNYSRANYLGGYSAGKDTIFDSYKDHLLDTLSNKKGRTPYMLQYFYNGLAVSPVVTVSMPAYYIGKYEVTQAQWNAVMGRKPTGNYNKIPDAERNAAWYAETGLGDNIAAYNISYDDAVEFCARLTAITGVNFRLPTEAEWECAARGGKATKGYAYIGADNYGDAAWNYNNACAVGLGSDNYGVHAGGELEPNELGIYDMAGNVSEWVRNSYYVYNYHDSICPFGGPITGDTLILRGGSWTQKNANEFSAGCRKKFIKSSYSEQSFLDAIAYCGFRIVVTPQ